VCGVAPGKRLHLFAAKAKGLDIELFVLGRQILGDPGYLNFTSTIFIRATEPVANLNHDRSPSLAGRLCADDKAAMSGVLAQLRESCKRGKGTP
jgi:hypothetical protein